MKSYLTRDPAFGQDMLIRVCESEAEYQVFLDAFLAKYDAYYKKHPHRRGIDEHARAFADDIIFQDASIECVTFESMQAAHDMKLGAHERAHCLDGHVDVRTGKKMRYRHHWWPTTMAPYGFLRWYDAENLVPPWMLMWHHRRPVSF